jgi:GNAT superfamily N-acetyltransferase
VWKPEDLYAIVCRPALPKDTPDVIDLTKTIWEGHDYVPIVWQDWLADPEGLLAVAEYGGRAVGLVKLSHLSPGEWWLEGLRVDPEFQGRHIASHLHHYIVDYWARIGDGALRLITYRPQVKNLCERTGFISRCEYSLYLAPIQEGSVDFARVEPGEVALARDFALESPVFACSAGLMDVGWHWTALTLPAMEAAVSEGRAWWWQGRQGLLVVREDDEEIDGVVEKLPFIQLVACRLSQAAACLEAYRRLGAALGYRHAALNASVVGELPAALAEASFQRMWEGSVSLFERTK